MRRQVWVLSVMFAVASALAGIPSTGWAHSATGSMAIDADAGDGPGQVRVRVRLVYASDNDPALAATVTASFVAAPWTVGPIPLVAGTGGTYEGVLDVPPGTVGVIRVTSVNPAAQAEQSITAPTAAAVPNAARSDGALDLDTDGNGGGEWFVPVIAGVVAITAAAGYIVFRRRRTSR